MAIKRPQRGRASIGPLPSISNSSQIADGVARFDQNSETSSSFLTTGAQTPKLNRSVVKHVK
jgi:hypothetical protein